MADLSRGRPSGVDIRSDREEARRARRPRGAAGGADLAVPERATVRAVKRGEEVRASRGAVVSVAAPSWIVLLVGLALARCAGGCGHARRAPEGGDAASTTPLAVSVSGCARITRTVDCAVGETRIVHVWSTGIRAGTLTVRDETGALVVSPPRDVEGGSSFDVTVPAGRHRLRITAVRSNGDVAERDLTVADDEAPRWLTEAKALRAGGHADAAESSLGPALAPDAPAIHRAWATGVLARIELRRGHLDRHELGGR